jgi:allantoinase
MASWTIRSERVVLPGGMQPATIAVEDGRIVEVTPGTSGAVRAGGTLIDAAGSVVIPGLVDTHVHINEPGRTDWEGFLSATRAAAAGGITTLVDMPLNCIPATTTVEALEIKRAAARGQCHVDVGFWGGVVPGNEGDIGPLAEAGVLGYKCFLSPSGVDEFRHVSGADLERAAPMVAGTGLPLLVHAEWSAMLLEPPPDADLRLYSTWLHSRPPAAEHAAVDLLIDLSARTRLRAHIVHLASADAVPHLIQARGRGVPVTVETCPHYLAFCAEDIGAGTTAWKCAPPIRERDHRERLWTGLQNGHIDLVATDHSPAPPATKDLHGGNFMAAWGGIASLQVSLPVMLTAARARNIPIERLAAWMAMAPARLAGLDGRKGAIVAGYDADLVIVEAEREFTVDASRLYHRHAVTPYDGARLSGVVAMTMVRGEIVFANGEIVGPPRGELLTRNR